MQLPRETAAILAMIAISGILFSSLVVLQPEVREVTFGAAPPTPYSTDHARAQGNARDEEPSSTF